MRVMRCRRWAAVAFVALGVGGMYQITGCSGTGPECVLGICMKDGPHRDCVESLIKDDGAVIEGPGVFFVSASAVPGGNGSKAQPFQRFADAAGKNPKRVYACAGEYVENESVSFKEGVEIYAGFTGCDSDEWRWSKTRSILKGPRNAVALALHEGHSCIGNLDVIAADADVAGGSSIAVAADGGTVAIVNGKLTAGNARDGSPGSSPPEDGTLHGKAGEPGVDACDQGTHHDGPTGATTACSTGGTSTGGNGGNGGTIILPTSTAGAVRTPGDSGGDGTSSSPAPMPKGEGGRGEDSEGTACSGGQHGTEGGMGEAGSGAKGPGMISAAGYTGNNGVDGLAGKPGQGGGGGGGARGTLGAVCPGAKRQADVPGASGGAGGSGGCGGRGGGGGQAGGSSIALMILDASVQLENVDLSAGKAGGGGQGGKGQKGGKAGSGGGSGHGIDSALNSCDGGDGGDGGRGGPGGGGQGGHSLGIAFKGSSPPAGGAFVRDPENKGTGGKGGGDQPRPPGSSGADGQAERCWDFTANSACNPQ
jgi:hypothetical protein